MSKSSINIILTIILASSAASAVAVTPHIDSYQEIKIKAKQEGEVSVIVTLGTNESFSDMLSNLENSKEQLAIESYTEQQDEFMEKLGSAGVYDYHYFDESPSISLKLNYKALRRLLRIKEVVSMVPVLDAYIF